MAVAGDEGGGSYGRRFSSGNLEINWTLWQVRVCDISGSCLTLLLCEILQSKYTIITPNQQKIRLLKYYRNMQTIFSILEKSVVF